MNILYLAELNPFSCSGGGESILSDLLKVGIEKFDERVIINTPNDSEQAIMHNINNCDFVFCADMDNEPNKNPRTWFSKKVFCSIIDKKDYITFATGYCDVCRQDYAPCNLSGKLNCAFCPKKDGLRVQFFKNAKRNFFLSPLQRDYSLKHLGISTENSAICIPDIDTSLFKNNHVERDIDYIICGVICHAKGYFNICKYIEEHNLQDKNIVFVGPSILGQPKYGKWIPKIPRNEMPNYMNRAKFAINLPVWPESHGLVSEECCLCGCNLITNKMLGAASCFNYNLEELKNPANFTGNYIKFWENIECIK